MKIFPKFFSPLIFLLIAGLSYLLVRPESLDLCKQMAGYTGQCFWTNDISQLIFALLVLYSGAAFFILFLGAFLSDKTNKLLQKFSLIWIILSIVGISFIPDGGGLPPLPGGRDIIILLAGVLYFIISLVIIVPSFFKKKSK
jgi:hypothetical protein